MGLALPTHRWHLSASREDATVFYDGREVAQCYTRHQARAIAIRANRADELDRIAWLVHPDVIAAFDRLIQARLAFANDNPAALDEYYNAWANAIQIYAERRASALGAHHSADPVDLAQAMQAECARLLDLISAETDVQPEAHI